ncbi:hypothetical protein GCM10027034_30330 [Ramlibacter solisilvae]|uniref:DUF1439 domain-containing protein n=1 Tax=Ramlibacter tataouinensis TaxID=94132 RepID=A0A127JRS0_9BURK|nr:hypothetical protein [Ramlibacter tataouinensis]AMO22605.1 hypothetical protein UC35_06545 [Ramlibacter tataouinensis]
MHRRLMITALACWPALVLAQDEVQRPRHKVSAGELSETLASRFPVRLGVAGLLELRVGRPRLLLVPARNKLGAGLLLQVSGAQVPQLPAGEMEVVFALRYEASDQTIRAHRAEILDLRWPGMPPEILPTIQAMLPEMTRNLGEVVLHRLSTRELALPDTMGLEPQELQVVDDGLLILFGPKRRS